MPKPAKVVVGLYFMLQLAHDQLNHDGVVEVTDARYLIWNQVFRFGEIGKGIQNPGSVFLWKAPFMVDQHVDHEFQLTEPFPYEGGYFLFVDLL